MINTIVVSVILKATKMLPFEVELVIPCGLPEGYRLICSEVR
jgi:hypothetical protein